jgi:DNA-binding LacI/PurR family transcriptional regulator
LLHEIEEKNYDNKVYANMANRKTAILAIFVPMISSGMYFGLFVIILYNACHGNHNKLSLCKLYRLISRLNDSNVWYINKLMHLRRGNICKVIFKVFEKVFEFINN